MAADKNKFIVCKSESAGDTVLINRGRILAIEIKPYHGHDGEKIINVRMNIPELVYVFTGKGATDFLLQMGLDADGLPLPEMKQMTQPASGTCLELGHL